MIFWLVSDPRRTKRVPTGIDAVELESSPLVKRQPTGSLLRDREPPRLPEEHDRRNP
jgi:hypothetical protein